jgi:hypothetical protein
MLIDVRHPRLSVLRQCDLPGLSRSSLYYRAQGEDAYNQQLMRWVDSHYTSHPYLGVGRRAAMLRRDGHAVALAEPEVRRGVSAGLRDGDRGPASATGSSFTTIAARTRR